MTNYITHLDVSLNAVDEQKLQSEGFRKIEADLNKGARGKDIFLWYKRGSTPITRLQVTFRQTMEVGLNTAGYTKIPKDLNTGAGGDYVYLWYFRGQKECDTPIVEIDVTTDAESEAQKFRSGWERLACDLNRNTGGNWIHVWVKRLKQTYICEVTAINSYGLDVYYFEKGYTRVDEDTNREAGGPDVFIWYLRTTDPQHALNDLNISTNDRERQSLQQQNYRPVSVNLNDGHGDNQVYLWYKKDKVNSPIKAITLLLNPAAVEEYEKADLEVIKRDLNTGNKGRTEYLCVYQ